MSLVLATIIGFASLQSISHAYYEHESILTPFCWVADNDPFPTTNFEFLNPDIPESAIFFTSYEGPYLTHFYPKAGNEISNQGTLQGGWCVAHQQAIHPDTDWWMAHVHYYHITGWTVVNIDIPEPQPVELYIQNLAWGWDAAVYIASNNSSCNEMIEREHGPNVKWSYVNRVVNKTGMAMSLCESHLDRWNITEYPWYYGSTSGRSTEISIYATGTPYPATAEAIPVSKTSWFVPTERCVLEPCSMRVGFYGPEYKLTGWFEYWRMVASYATFPWTVYGDKWDTVPESAKGPEHEWSPWPDYDDDEGWF